MGGVGTQGSVSKLNLSDNQALRLNAKCAKLSAKVAKKSFPLRTSAEILCALCVSKALPSSVNSAFRLSLGKSGLFSISRFADHLAQAATEFTFASSERHLWCLPG